MFSMDFFRGENERLEKTIPQQGGAGGVQTLNAIAQ